MATPFFGRVEFNCSLLQTFVLFQFWRLFFSIVLWRLKWFKKSLCYCFEVYLLFVMFQCMFILLYTFTCHWISCFKYLCSFSFVFVQEINCWMFWVCWIIIVEKIKTMKWYVRKFSECWLNFYEYKWCECSLLKVNMWMSYNKLMFPIICSICKR